MVTRSRVGTSSASAATTKVGQNGAVSRDDGTIEFVPDPRRRRVTKELVRELEDAGLLETAKVAKKLAS